MTPPRLYRLPGKTTWRINYYDPSKGEGEAGRVRRSLGTDDEAKAKAVAREVGKLIGPVADARKSAGPRLTFDRYADTWLKERRARGVRSVGHDEQRLRDHVRPRLGALALGDITQQLVREVLTATQAKGLAPRTQSHVHGVLHALLEEAHRAGLIARNPAALPRGQRPRVRDADPRWRSTAVYARHELELLLREAEPQDRVAVALQALAGLRWGEVAEVRWHDYEPGLEPLGRLTVSRSWDTRAAKVAPTKTDVERLVPVHPVLAAVLAEWRLGGWAELLGRPPVAADLVLPRWTGAQDHRGDSDQWKRNARLLERLRLRRRRQHDYRRAMISLARAGGARRDVLELVTHGARRRGIVDLYTELPWELLCAQVACIDVVPGREAQVVRMVSNGGSDGPELDSETCSADRGGEGLARRHTGDAGHLARAGVAGSAALGGVGSAGGGADAAASPVGEPLPRGREAGGVRLGAGGRGDPGLRHGRDAGDRSGAGGDGEDGLQRDPAASARREASLTSGTPRHTICLGARDGSGEVVEAGGIEAAATSRRCLQVPDIAGAQQQVPACADLACAGVPVVGWWGYGMARAKCA